MNKSESIKNLAVALAKFQGEVQNPKNTADNPFFKSKYTPLNDVLNLVRPLLTKHGLSILQSPSGDGTNIVITTILMHDSGEWIEPEPLVLKADKATAQGAGSAITYGRRYSLSAILGISSEDDDDGNHASGDKPQGGGKPQGRGNKKPTQPETSQPPADGKGKPEQPQGGGNDWSSFWVSVKNLGYTPEQVHKEAGTNSLTGLTHEQRTKLLNQLAQKKQQMGAK